MSHSAMDSHITDEALLRYLDREVSGDTRSNVRLHLRRCPACLQRAREVRALAATVDAELTHLDWDPPPGLLPRTFAEVRLARQRPAQRGASFFRGAAAVLLVLAAGAFFASPLRARVLDWVGERIGAAARIAGIGAPAPAPPAVAPPTRVATAQSSEIGFVPEGGELRLTFSHPQQDGTLRITASAEKNAWFRVLASDTARVPVFVLPSEIRITNSQTDRASYELVVPPTVQTVRVVAGGVAVFRAQPPSTGQGQEITLPVSGAAIEPLR